MAMPTTALDAPCTAPPCGPISSAELLTRRSSRTTSGRLGMRYRRSPQPDGNLWLVRGGELDWRAAAEVRCRRTEPSDLCDRPACPLSRTVVRSVGNARHEPAERTWGFRISGSLLLSTWSSAVRFGFGRPDSARAACRPNRRRSISSTLGARVGETCSFAREQVVRYSARRKLAGTGEPSLFPASIGFPPRPPPRRGAGRSEGRSSRAGPDQIDSLLDTAFAIEARSWKGVAGTALVKIRSAVKHFASSPLGRAAPASYGSLAANWRDLCRHANRRRTNNSALWLLKIGFDPAFANCSPGNLLLAESIRYAVRRNLSSLEFLGTFESWTKVWTEHERKCVSLRYYPLICEGRPDFWLTSAHSISRSLRFRGHDRVEQPERRRSESRPTPTPANDQKCARNRRPDCRRAEARCGAGSAPSIDRRAKAPLLCVGTIAARSYIAGDRFDDAIHVARRFAKRGVSATIGFLGWAARFTPRPFAGLSSRRWTASRVQAGRVSIDQAAFAGLFAGSLAGLALRRVDRHSRRAFRCPRPRVGRSHLGRD